MTDFVDDGGYVVTTARSSFVHSDLPDDALDKIIAALGIGEQKAADLKSEIIRSIYVFFPKQ
jgi:hypothetical protein